MKVWMAVLRSYWSKPGVQWFARTVYYLLILIGLLWIYGFKETNTSTFIYNDF